MFLLELFYNSQPLNDLFELTTIRKSNTFNAGRSMVTRWLAYAYLKRLRAVSTTSVIASTASSSWVRPTNWRPTGASTKILGLSATESQISFYQVLRETTRRHSHTPLIYMFVFMIMELMSWDTNVRIRIDSCHWECAGCVIQSVPHRGVKRIAGRLICKLCVLKSHWTRNRPMSLTYEL